MNRIMLFFITLFFISVCYAGIYFYKDKSGNTIYSDIPVKNATKINIEEKSVSTTNTSTSEILPTASLPSIINTSPSESVKKYTTFSITKPLDQDTFQNQRLIQLSLMVEPKLQSGDKIQLYLDGKKWGAAMKSTQFDLIQLDRGTHSIYATLINSEGAVLNQSNTITIFVHYAALGTS